ncbi:MAG: ribulose-phosphate 3-epimerase [Planctomycetota bacterium]
MTKDDHRASQNICRNVLRRRSGGAHLAPSILAADFARLADECYAAADAGATVMHLDVMDGHFVPNLTFGPALVRCLRAELPDVCFDAHLMVTDPASFVEPFVAAGCDHITFHAEVVDEHGARDLADRIRSLGCTAGLAINPETPFESVKGWLDAFEMLLIMSVRPGFAGQAFMGEVLDKTRTARASAAAELWIQMDGGLSPANEAEVRAAGCDILVMGSAFFGRPRDEWAGIARSVTSHQGGETEA